MQPITIPPYRFSAGCRHSAEDCQSSSSLAKGRWKHRSATNTPGIAASPVLLEGLDDLAESPGPSHRRVRRSGPSAAADRLRVHQGFPWKPRFAIVAPLDFLRRSIGTGKPSNPW